MSGNTTTRPYQLLKCFAFAIIIKVESNANQRCNCRLKDDKELKPSTHFIMELNGNEAKLMIDNATLGDSGNYTCVAENDSGKVEASAELRVGREF
jgi:hypothetical protein